MRVTNPQKAWILENHKTMTNHQMVKAFNAHFNTEYTLQAIYTKTRRLGVVCKKGKRKGIYTKEQIEFLQKNINEFNRQEMVTNFNAHFNLEYSFEAVYGKIKRLGLRFAKKNSKFFYNADQIQFLQEHCSHLNITELTKAFNTEFQTTKRDANIGHILREYGLKAKRKERVYSNTSTRKTPKKKKTASTPQIARRIIRKKFVPLPKRAKPTPEIKEDDVIIPKKEKFIPRQKLITPWMKKYLSGESFV